MDVYQLPPLYPSKITKPLELDKSERYGSLLEYKKNLRNDLKNSFYFIENNDSLIERYSDRYSKIKKADINKWQPDWNRLPKELKYFYEKDEKRTRKRKDVMPNLTKRKLVKKKLDLKLLENINGEEEMENEEDEEMEDDVKKEKKSDKGSDEEDENGEDLENADEEEVEEGNDYIDAYFDNGENYGDDDGGGDDDGPTY